MKLFKSVRPFLKILLVYMIVILSQSCDAICPAKDVDCQVYLEKGQTSPYRGLKAAYRGWHYPGNVQLQTCWKSATELCEVCPGEFSKRARLCQQKYKGSTTRPGVGVTEK